jgi:hypothetical protein
VATAKTNKFKSQIQQIESEFKARLSSDDRLIDIKQSPNSLAAEEECLTKWEKSS